MGNMASYVDPKIYKLRRLIRDHACEFAEKIHPVYVALNWKWYPDIYIPTVDDLELLIYELTKDLDGIDKSISSGGITVGINEVGVPYIEFSLLEYLNDN